MVLDVSENLWSRIHFLNLRLGHNFMHLLDFPWMILMLAYSSRREQSLLRLGWRQPPDMN